MAFPNPNLGQGVAASKVGLGRSQKLPHEGGGAQTPRVGLNASVGRPNALMGGGGMEVGPLMRKGVPRNPKAARNSLLNAMKGGY